MSAALVGAILPCITAVGAHAHLLPLHHVQSKRPRQRWQPDGAPRAGLAGTSLKQRIRAADSCEGVAALMRAHPQCTIPELTTAINRMANRHEACERSGGSSAQLAANRAVFGQLASLALRRLEQLDAYACAQLFWAAAKMQAPLTAEQQAAWEARTAQVLPEGKPQSISLILWAYGALHQLCGLQPSRSLLPALEKQLPRALQDGEPQNVANSLWGWAKLGQQLSPQQAAAAAAAIQRTAAGMTEQAVANTLWAYANGGWQLSSEAAAALAEQLPRVLKAGNAQDVANSLWAWSKLGQPLSPQLAAAAGTGIQRTATRMKPQEAVNTLWAFANGSWRLGSGAAAAAALEVQLPRMLADGEPQHVANSLWAWAKLGLPVNDEMRAVADAAVLRSAPAMVQEAVRQVSWAHHHGGWQLSAEALAAVEARRQQLLKSGKWH